MILIFLFTICISVACCLYRLNLASTKHVILEKMTHENILAMSIAQCTAGR